MEITFEAFIYGGKVTEIVPVNAKISSERLSLFDKGSKVIVSVKSYYRKRELSQNDIFHALCGQISKHSGLSFNVVKRRMKEEFGIWEPRVDRRGEVVYDNKGNIIYRTKDTTEYNTNEMAELIHKVAAFSSSFLNNKLPEIEFFKKVNIEL